MIMESSALDDQIGGNAQIKIDAFFKSFDDDGDRCITKNEWLNFYGKLFDNIVNNGLSPTPANNE